MSSPLALLATPRRAEILRLVWREERSAGEIHRTLGDVTFGAVSQHLRLLAEAGWVEMRPEGRRRLYRARVEALGPVAAALEAMWDDALYRLRLAAELEAGRRGPRRRARSPRLSRTLRSGGLR
jgi:DNA-binding transcriptional ArsR family regulator